MKPNLFLLLLVLLLSGITMQAQTKEDSLAIQKVCKDYTEGWAEGNIDRVANSLSEELVKRTIRMDQNGVYQIINMSASQLISWTKRNKEEGKVTSLKDLEPEKEFKPDIMIYDICGNFASAKIAISKYGFFDYCHLVKFNGEWKIFHALYGPLSQEN
jgi:hypothetical protein